MKSLLKRNITEDLVILQYSIIVDYFMFIYFELKKYYDNQKGY